jgi:hypothetical protein
LATADDVIMPIATAADMDPEVLRKRVEAAVVPETVVLDLRVKGSSPEEAVALTRAVSERFMAQLSALNVQAGGPVMRPTQISAPQRATAPDQLHGRTLAGVSALVGLTFGVLLALQVAVIKRNRAASRSPATATRAMEWPAMEWLGEGEADSVAPDRVPATTRYTTSGRTANG